MLAWLTGSWHACLLGCMHASGWWCGQVQAGIVAWLVLQAGWCERGRHLAGTVHTLACMHVCLLTWLDTLAWQVSSRPGQATMHSPRACSTVPTTRPRWAGQATGSAATQALLSSTRSSLTHPVESSPTRPLTNTSRVLIQCWLTLITHSLSQSTSSSTSSSSPHGIDSMALDAVMILPQVHLRKPCYDFSFL
jgi:hypothetical protein